MRRISFFLLLIFSITLFSAEKRPKVCLNMIVKDESEVIERSLASVKPLIDYWVIVDTGSTDGTQKIIKKFMKGIPGKLYERPWVNFEHNRNEALELAKGKGDYVLFIDADEEMILEEGFSLPPLSKDLYYITTQYGGTNYVRSQLVNNHLNWKWVGVLHEVLVCNDLKTFETLKGIYNYVRHEGCRSKQSNRFLKDAAILEEALKKEPENTRYMFYLAQSLRDAGELERSLQAYEKRIEKGGWDEEVFWSKYQVALLKDRLERPSNEVIKAYQDAYSFRPTRAEPLCRLARHLRLKGDYLLGYLAASHGLSIQKPDDVLFVEDWIYRYELLIEQTVCAYWIGKYQECLVGCDALLKRKGIPESTRELIESNKKWAVLQLQSN